LQNITVKEHCRAYRVFEHYITKLESEAQADATVFLVQTQTRGRVFLVMLSERLESGKT